MKKNAATIAIIASAAGLFLVGLGAAIRKELIALELRVEEAERAYEEREAAYWDA